MHAQKTTTTTARRIGEHTTPEGSGGKPWQEGVLDNLLGSKKETKKELVPYTLGASHEDTIGLHTL